MKSLQLDKPHAIVTIWIQGSGKTFFAKKFADTFNAPFFEESFIAAHAKDEASARELTDATLTELLKTGRSIVIEQALSSRNDRTELDPGASWGLHIEWDTNVGPAPISLLARTRTHFDTDRGSQADLRATAGVYGRAGLFVALFGQATWATDDWVLSYYGAGNGGLLFTALGVEGAYDLNRRWVLLASAHARRLHGDAASSPITEDKTNLFASAAVAYRF